MSYYHSDSNSRSNEKIMASPNTGTSSIQQQKQQLTHHDKSQVSSMIPLSKNGLGQEECGCGWLWMRTGKLRSWKYRYFSLQPPILTYYDKFPTEEYFKSNNEESMDEIHGCSEGTQPLGVIRVAHVEELVTNKLGFKVFGKSGKALEIRCAKAASRVIWLAALKPIARRRSRAWSFHSEVSSPRSSSSPSSVSFLCSSLPEDHPNQNSVEDCLSSNSYYSLDQRTLTRSLKTTRSDSTSADILKVGWMYKKSDVLQRWRRYFFVLQGSMISYYTTDKPHDIPRRRGYVTSVVRVVKLSKARGNADEDHELQVTLNTGRALHVTPEHKQELLCWYKLLSKAVDETQAWSRQQSNQYWEHNNVGADDEYRHSSFHKVSSSSLNLEHLIDEINYEDEDYSESNSCDGQDIDHFLL